MIPFTSARYFATRSQLFDTSFHVSPSDFSHVYLPSANASPSYEKMRGCFALTTPLSDAKRTISSSAWLRVTPTEATFVYAAPYQYTRSSSLCSSAGSVKGSEKLV